MRKLQFFLWLPPFICAKNIVRLKAADNPAGVLFFDHFTRSELFIPIYQSGSITGFYFHMSN